MARKVIISLAPVAAGTPVDKIALAEDVRLSVEKGAGMCHLRKMHRQPKIWKAYVKDLKRKFMISN